jgi:hypothetical protein
VGQVAGEGVEVTLPAGWEGRLSSRPSESTEAVASASAAGLDEPEERDVLVQVANFPLPAEMGDFGGGVTPTMGSRDVLVILAEYGEGAAATPLFAAEGIPRLRPNDASPATLRYTMPGQSAIQRFFHVGDRAFCLYAVLGSHARRIGQVGLVNDLLRNVRID